MSTTLAAPTAWPTHSDGRLHTGLITGPAAHRVHVLADLAAHADRSAAPTRVWAVSPNRTLPTTHVVWAEDTGADIHHHLAAVIDHRSRQLESEAHWGGEPCALYPQILALIDDVENTTPTIAQWSQVLARGACVGVVLVFATGTDAVDGLADAVDHHQGLEAVR